LILSPEEKLVGEIVIPLFLYLLAAEERVVFFFDEAAFETALEAAFGAALEAVLEAAFEVAFFAIAMSNTPFLNR
jgi:hypothetical protein